MARPISDFTLPWSALAGQSQAEGWRVIPIAPAGPCALLAGRRFPGNEEALLVRFRTATVPPAAGLPEGNGFEVCRADPLGDGSSCIAITRRDAGSRELFAEMVCDVAGAMDAQALAGEQELLRTLIGRVRSWQEFMRRGTHALDGEAEIGLVGELSFLSALLDLGLDSFLAVEAWVGPLDAPQDFFLAGGAVEVKSSLARTGFPARIGSLDQLDDSLRAPLFLAATRLSLRDSGASLPEIADRVLLTLGAADGAARIFADRLLTGGYHEVHRARYHRRFEVDNIRVVRVVEGTPRITPGTVPVGVRKVSYEIDLDRAPGPDVGIVGALRGLSLL